MKLGSLFSGSGGFELAGALYGIEPVWAAEVEPYPIAVTRSRFPGMKHYGNVCEIDGGKIEPVDIITFGSPCQDMSVAGKRAGMNHTEHGAEETTRSGLFYEAIRIIREMREASNGRYPNYAVWENVPGAFSSNGGSDFRCVLEQFIGLCGKEVPVPEPPKGRWGNAGLIEGDGWSIAWRVLDAQFWGVPQRRKRIYLVADFGSERAGSILFEQNRVPRYFAAGREAWKGAAADAPGGAGGSDRVKCMNPWDCESKRQHQIDGCYPTLNAGQSCGGQAHGICYGICSYESNSMKSSNPHSGIYEADTSRTLDLNGGNPACNQGGVCVVAYDGQNCLCNENVTSTLQAGRMDNHSLPSVCMECVSIENHPADSRVQIMDDGKVQTLSSRMGTGGVMCRW